MIPKQARGLVADLAWPIFVAIFFTVFGAFALWDGSYWAAAGAAVMLASAARVIHLGIRG